VRVSIRFRSLVAVVLCSLIVAGCGDTYTELSESGRTVALWVPIEGEVNELTRSIDAEVLLEPGERQKYGITFIIPNSQGVPGFEFGLDSQSTDAEIAAFESFMLDLGASEVVQLTVDDQWPSCVGEQDCPLVWKSVEGYFD